jgi:hypothetical protein
MIKSSNEKIRKLLGICLIPMNPKHQGQNLTEVLITSLKSYYPELKANPHNGATLNGVGIYLYYSTLDPGTGFLDFHKMFAGEPHGIQIHIDNYKINLFKIDEAFRELGCIR